MGSQTLQVPRYLTAGLVVEPRDAKVRVLLSAGASVMKDSPSSGQSIKTLSGAPSGSAASKHSGTAGLGAVVANGNSSKARNDGSSGGALGSAHATKTIISVAGKISRVMEGIKSSNGPRVKQQRCLGLDLTRLKVL